MPHATFGLFDWIDRGNVPLHQLYEERLQLIEVADAAGFFCYHLAEHHATPLGMAPSPALFLSSVTQRTQQIHLGPLAYLLPLYNPLRLIEEVCMLDHLADGRLELGVSRGSSLYELGYFGVDNADKRASMFEEALTILLAGLTQERLTFEGVHYQYQDVPMELHPRQQPYPPLWYPTSSLQSIERVAKHGLHFVGLGPAKRVREQVDLYWQTWGAHRQDPDRLNSHVAKPKVGIMRQIYLAESDNEALTTARAAHRNWYYAINKLRRDHDDQSSGGFSWEEMTRAEAILFGSPARVREQMARLLEVSGCDYVICAFAWGSLPHEQALRSLRLFTQEVMSAFTGDAT